ncbi:hypothetical protein K450DRAFT_236239 [Umbelopsis ramanniana AG]|uniref:AB hydrolase-1 domain-containing protein n=1 Tax=Umbelopsis ramanniana AG TaxID=1314678 RepID=A0AAD5ECS1_UMBRA|nr:uncharacterized protein K450DRAFT_236239 [Umbelopsis ramanniana AG]KAI8580565.1 hypothetical protein K450DRAFT_236239 [Umbelopsis ramanniana AG]
MTDIKHDTTPTLPAVIPPTSHLNFLRTWWQRSDKTSEIAESRLLNHYLTKNVIARVDRVDIGGENRFINTLVVEKANNKNLSRGEVEHGSNDGPVDDKKALVMCHGYGAGLGFFYKNYNDIAQASPGYRIFSIDWLGMGRSSRPKWQILKKRNQSWDDVVEETESHFIQCLEDWRKAQKLEKMTLMGHSLGGYMATCYALKHPERVEKLILVSPVGLPVSPFDQTEEDKPEVALPKEAEQLGKAMEAEVTEREFQNSPNGTPRRIPSWAAYLWDKNVTPMSVVRLGGPLGARLVNQYTSRRFAHLNTEEQHSLYDYLYHITSSTGSGEYALASVLSPGAYARKPLIHRLPELKMPTVFIYGTIDWMDYKSAEEAGKKMSVYTKIYRISAGGHHMYLDNHKEFNDVVTEVLGA